MESTIVLVFDAEPMSIVSNFIVPDECEVKYASGGVVRKVPVWTQYNH